jgi:hypothetical protein
MFRKNKDGMNSTALVDVVVSALQMKNEHYTMDYTDSDLHIYWKHHNVRIKGECIWFDNKIQRSVYNVINCIKAGN